MTGASGLLVLLLSGELAPANIVYFCVAASNAVGLIAGGQAFLHVVSSRFRDHEIWDMSYTL